MRHFFRRMWRNDRYSVVVPKYNEPKTYDQFVGVTLMNAARMKGLTQSDLAAQLKMSDRTFTRRMAGDPGFMVRELEVLAGFIGVKPGRILQDALDALGGLDPLLSEVRGNNDPLDGDAEVLEMLDRRSREESKQLGPQQVAAHRGKKGTTQ